VEFVLTKSQVEKPPAMILHDDCSCPSFYNKKIFISGKHLKYWTNPPRACFTATGQGDLPVL